MVSGRYIRVHKKDETKLERKLIRRLNFFNYRLNILRSGSRYKEQQKSARDNDDV
jgi:hypothetical protein